MNNSLCDIFPGSSEMSALMRAHRWDATPLGDPAHWPAALKAPLRLMLMSRFEMWLGWGPDLSFFYNDAYIPTLGVKHPGALGTPMSLVWKEVFENVKDRIDSVMRDGVATWDEQLLLLLERNGYPEETYHTFSYSPLIGDNGSIDGLMCVVSEETERVIGERRLKLLNDLGGALLKVETREDILLAASSAFALEGRDFPFGEVVLFDAGQEDASMQGAMAKWPGEAILRGAKQSVVALDALLTDPPKGPWDSPPQEALLVPIEQAGQARPIGFLALALNPFSRLDDATGDFARLLAGQIAGALATVDAASAQRIEVARLRDLFAQSPSFIAVLQGPEHRFEFVNPSYLQLIAHRDVIGHAVRDALPEIEGQGFYELLDGVFANGEAYVGRSVPITLQRTPEAEVEDRVLDFVYQPIRNDEGAITGIFVEGIDVTMAHDVVAALKESEEQFRTFAQAMPNHIWRAPPSGQLDWFNVRVFEYSGLNEDALVGDGWTTIVHPDDRETAGAAWAIALETGDIYETEFRIRRHDGEYRWHLVRALPIRGDDGDILRWIGTNTDIHDQKLSEVETLRDRNRLWTLSQDLMLISDYEGIIRAVNPSAMRMLGWGEDDMVGHILTDFVHPDDIARTAAEVEKLADGVTTLSFENRYRCQNGTYRLLEWNAVPDVGRIHAVARDITEERRLARDRDRIWALSPVVKVVAELSGKIVAANPSWTAVLGWNEAETTGRQILEFISEDLHSAQARLAKLAIEGAGVVESQSVFRAKDGSGRRFAWTTIPEGGMLYLFGRDITVETEAAEALASAEEALRQSQKMEAVGQLTGGIAHDFNNLLAGILGNLELLELRIAQGRLDAIPRHLQTAQGAAKRAAALTQRLLAFSRRQTLDPTPVNVNSLIAGLEDLVRRTVGPSIEIEVVGAGGLWATLVDRYQLENALLNLCINARDAMPDGGRLTIETANKWLDERAARERELPPGQYVSLCVTDTGTGMTPQVIARAFDPFFTTKPLGEGTGLGLSMIYGFVRQSGGQVRIYSEVGSGTTMCIYLPRHLGAVEEPEGDGHVTNVTAEGHGETVLVIDDETSVRSLIVDVLADSGYHVVEAADGLSGLKILQSDMRIDLLVTDVGLPGGMNGRQVADAGRVLRPELKILFITGYAENAVVGNGLLDHGMQIITKPFGIEAIATKIRDLIDEGDRS